MRMARAQFPRKLIEGELCLDMALAVILQGRELETVRQRLLQDVRRRHRGGFPKLPVEFGDPRLEQFDLLVEKALVHQRALGSGAGFAVDAGAVLFERLAGAFGRSREPREFLFGQERKPCGRVVDKFGGDRTGEGGSFRRIRPSGADDQHPAGVRGDKLHRCRHRRSKTGFLMGCGGAFAEEHVHYHPRERMIYGFRLPGSLLTGSGGITGP